MDKKEILEKIEKINGILSGDLQEQQKFIDIMRDDDDPKKIFADLRRAVGSLSLLLDAQDLRELAHPKNKAIQDAMYPTGSMVSIRPCSDEYEDKTFIGFLIGDVSKGSSITVDEGKIQLNYSGYNPAILVPKLGKVIYGMESWWGVIESEEDFKKISDEDIENVWYVKAFREMAEKEEKEADA